MIQFIEIILDFIHCYVLDKPPKWKDAVPCELKYCRWCGNGRRTK
jgi:hypothetical protein